jgi:ATP-binding cassette, subfamily C (CFTR/MRP), member 1
MRPPTILRQKVQKYQKFDDIDLEDDLSNHGSSAGAPTPKWWKISKWIGNVVLFTWMKPLLELGNEQPLDFSDLYELSAHDQAEHINDSFNVAWNKQLTKESPSIVLAYVHAFGLPFFMAGGLKLIHDSLLFSGPYLLNRIISFLDDPSQPLSTGLYLVTALFITNALMSLCLRQYFFRCFRVGLRLRSAVITSIFAKSLVISPGVLGRRSIGEISNMMSADSTRLQNLVSYLHAVWFTFLQMGLALYFLWQLVGVACLGGI